MSLVTASIVRTLRATADLDARARKLLAFVDNRQDASLQAGHFNDFVQVTQLRGALYRALTNAEDGLTDEIVARKVTEELGLTMADFAQKPDAKYSQKDEALRALREVTGYRLYLDLERGWRVTMPNLEQTGLLRIHYRDLPEVAQDEEAWEGAHQVLRDDEPKHREEIAAALLDELRRNLAIDVEYLTEDGFDLVRRLSAQHLKEPWSLPERERPPLAGVAFPGPGKRGQSRSNIYVSGRGQFGRFIIREYAKRNLKATDAGEIIKDLFTVLSEAGLLIETVKADGDDTAGYRLRAAVIHWHAGNGLSGAEDRVRPPSTTRKARGSTRSSATCTKAWPPPCPGCGPRSTPPRCHRWTGRSGSQSSARPHCRCCTARRRWNSAWTSTRCPRSGCGTCRPPRQTTRSAPGEPAVPGSPRWSLPIARPATPMTSTTSGGPRKWSAAAWRPHGSTSPTKTS